MSRDVWAGPLPVPVTDYITKRTAMKGLVKESLDLDGLTFQTNLPTPRPASGEVKIKVLATSVCGTDKHIYRSSKNKGIQEAMRSYLKPGQLFQPLIIGHEFSGLVEEVGPLPHDAKQAAADHNLTVEPGDYVTAEMHISCGCCNLCRSGNEHICTEVKVKGVHLDGCFAESVVVPYRNVILLGKAGDYSLISPRIGSMLDAFGNAVHSVEEADVRGKSVVVLGAGPLGLMITLLCRYFGAAKIFVTEVVDLERRFALAREFGADQCIDVSKGAHELYRSIQASCLGNNGVDVVFEVSGAALAYNDAFKIVGNGGLVILLGISERPLEGFDITQGIILKGVRVKGIYGRKMFQTWQTIKQLLLSKRFSLQSDLAKLLAKRDYSLDNYRDAFEALVSGQEMKLVFIP